MTVKYAAEYQQAQLLYAVPLLFNSEIHKFVSAYFLVINTVLVRPIYDRGTHILAHVLKKVEKIHSPKEG